MTNTTLRTITVADYLRFMELAEKYQDSTDPLMEFKFLSEYYGQDLSDMDEVTAKYALEEVVQEMTDVDSIKIPKQPNKTIKVGKVKYNIPHNLEHSAKMSQYVDYAGYIDRYDGPQHGIGPIVCAIFLRKPKELYSQVKLNDRIETMKQMRLVDSVALTSFFLIQSQQFRKITSRFFDRSQASEKTAHPTT